MTESPVQFTSEEIAQYDAREAELFRQLDAIGKEPVAPIEIKVEAPAPVVTTYVAPVLSPDLSDPDVIQETIRLTRYDKASAKCRKMRERLDTLEALPEPTERERRMIAATASALDSAEQAMKRAQDDLSRLRDNIDAWRAGPGREKRNASRRKVRNAPNAPRQNLKAMTEAERQQHLDDKNAGDVWKTKKRNAGWTEEQVVAGFVTYLAKRDERRKRKAIADAEAIEIERQVAAMQDLSTYGMFGN